MSTQNHSRTWLKIGILSLSLLAMTAPSISVAFPSLTASFPEASSTQVELISTLPSIGCTLSLFFSTKMGEKFGIKQTVMLGIILYLIGGVGPAFVNHLSLILLLRFVMGIGWGLFNSYSVSLFYRFFTGQELTDLLGYQNTTQNLGNAAFGVLLSVLVAYGWRVAFLGYAIGLIPLVLFGANVSIDRHQPEDHEEEKGTRINLANWVVMAFIIATFSLWLNMITKLPTFVTEQNIASASVASILLSLQGLTSMVSSSFFGKIYGRIGDKLMSVSLIGMAIGFVIIASGKNVWIVGLGVIVASIFFGWVFPSLFAFIGKASPESGNTGTSMVQIGANVGTFIAPFVGNGLGRLFGQTTIGGIFIICAGGFVILSLIYLLIVRAFPPQKANS